jgi:Tfp pilus assembly protein PilO
MPLPGENTMSAKITSAKRNQIIGLILATLLVLGGLGYGLIKRQYDNLQSLAKKKGENDSKLQLMDTAVKSADQLEVTLAEVSESLAEKEATMASGDIYSWSINTMKKFKANYQVEVPQFGPISSPAEVNLLPGFPYKQATLNVGGKAYYHDLGRFITDFENQFPFMRVVNLTLDANPGPGAGEREKLSFKMDIITLVKPGNS